MGRRGGAMSLAKSVTASNKSYCFLVVHGHARECVANVTRGGDWVWLAVWAFWININ